MILRMVTSPNAKSRVTTAILLIIKSRRGARSEFLEMTDKNIPSLSIPARDYIFIYNGYLRMSRQNQDISRGGAYFKLNSTDGMKFSVWADKGCFDG